MASNPHPPQATLRGELWEIAKWVIIIAAADFLATWASSYLGVHGNPSTEELVRWGINVFYGVMVLWVLAALGEAIIKAIWRRWG